MFFEKILTGSRTMDIDLTEAAAMKLARFYAMLSEANARMNLTRVPDTVDEAVDRNFLDSLAPLAHRDLIEDGAALIDVGSGAGFPGVPLAIARPRIRVTMIDSLAKRVNFLDEVIAELGLNAMAIHGRAEDLAHESTHRAQYDIATARAVAGLSTLMELTLPFVRVGGRLIAYKGPSADGEITQAENARVTLGAGTADVRRARIPGRDWDHRLIIFTKTDETPAKYPRKAGEPGRKPL